MARKPLRARLFAPRFEPLEDRRLLALAAFDVNLYRDVDGAPGELITGDTVQVGENFFAEITAEDVQEVPNGIHGISLNITWDPEVLTVIDAPFDVHQIITPKLPAFQLGTLDNEAGRIHDLGGSAFFAGELVGSEGAERFALLHFEALAPASGSVLALDAGPSRIAIFPHFWARSTDFDFEQQPINVVTATAPAPEPEAQLNVYQGANGAAASLVAADQIDTGRAAYVEVAVDPSPGPQTIAVSSLGTTVGGLLDAGHVMVTGLCVDVENHPVELPLAAMPLGESLSIPAATHTIGLTYSPGDAADVVLANTPADELASAAGPEIDDGLMQALTSGLAFAQEQAMRDPQFNSG